MTQNSELSTFVWKGNKILGEDKKYIQSEKRLIDMSEKELKNAYEHCKTMLFNKDNKNPGRYLVLDVINDQKNRCGVELFLREAIDQADVTTRFNLIGLINTFMNSLTGDIDKKKLVLSDMFSVDKIYENLPLTLVMDGCLDRLGVFNKKHITRAFILRQGIWLTSSESKDLLGEFFDTTDRLSIIRENLNIKDIEKLFLNSKGINFTQMRAMLNLKPNKKYRELTSVQLETLRYRILFDLEQTVKNHIESWETRMEEIEICTDHLGFKL